ncbi:MAG: response regulator transcription factor [Flavobacteriaceae bacterium]|nr:response regulator transcription factor [Flavobacteriaceae bacterium]
MKILIADDHDLVRDAITSLIVRDDSKTQVFQACDVQQSLDILEQQANIDLILLDVNMPGMDNLQSIKTIAEAYPTIPIAMISGEVKKQEVERSFEYGAKGFIPKTMNGKSLLLTLNLIISGTKYIPEVCLETEIDESIEINTLLSKRELQVLNELFKGHSNKLIANTLFIEETTIKLHLRSLFKKLNAKNRTEVVIKALKLGFSPS